MKKEIYTLGPSGKRKEFCYRGSVNEGTTIEYKKSPHIFVPSELYFAAIKYFKGKTIPGGFSMTDPIRGGLGEWLQKNSPRFGIHLTPRHGSHIAAILVHEGCAKSHLEKNKVMLHFL